MLEERVKRFASLAGNPHYDWFNMVLDELAYYTRTKRRWSRRYIDFTRDFFV